MLQRRGIRRSAVAVLALGTVVLFAACRSTPPPAAPPAQAAVSPDTWATVDGKAITRGDVEKAFRRMGDPSQAPSEEEALTAKLNILDDLILEEILLAKAQKQNLSVADTEIDMAFAEMKQGMTDEAFQQQLASRNLTVADMRDGLRRRLLSQKEVDRDVAAKITVTDQQVADFFNANRAQFNLTEDAFHLAQIVVTPVRDQQLANRTGDDAATPEAANQKIAMLMDRLTKGTPFADLAKDYSEDPESAPRGGDLGLVPLSAVKRAPAALRDAVLQLTPGRARVVTQGGAKTIVFVVSKEAAGQRDLSSPGVRQQITETLRTRREQLLRTAFLASIKTDAKVTNYLARSVVESQGKPPAAAK
jgi:peptidyl-prolyl cis-trans isomerase SurA